MFSNESLDLADFALADFIRLNEFIQTNFGVAEEAFATTGTAGFWLAICAARESCDPAELDAAWLDFEALCASASTLPRGLVLLLSIAYALTGKAAYDASSGGGIVDVVQCLVAAAEAKSMGLALSQSDQSSRIESERRRMLSIAGAKGAKQKNRRFEEVRAWVLSQVASLRMTDMAAARHLSGRIPSAFADVSKNPDRLFYDIIRSQRKKN